MVKRKTKAFSTPLVECPFCHEKVKAKKLADHAKSVHAGDSKYAPKRKSAQTRTLDGVEIRDTELVEEIKHHVIDESGMLIDPSLLQAEEPHKSHDERLKNVSLPNKISSRPEHYAPLNTFQKIGGKKKKIPGSLNKQAKTVDDTYREKTDWLEDKIKLNKLSDAMQMANEPGLYDLVECPVCKVAVKPNRIRKHLKKVHPGVQLSEEKIERLQQAPKSAGSGWKQTQLGARAFRQSLKMERERRLDDVSNKGDSAKSHENANLVKCPLCKHRTQYNVLFVHIQVGHPEVNPKFVMAKFNKAYKNHKSAEKDRYEDELRELAKEYERFKQGQDEPRDGGKYMGYMRREQGKFGSLPLYDDYSDEADAE